MKKFIVFLVVLISLLSINKSEAVVIPKEAIRFRVIANSNKKEDQELKQKVVENLKEDIKSINIVPQNILETRAQLKLSIPQFEKTIAKTIEAENAPNNYSIDYGMNYFPEKTYKGIKYEEGEYESVVVKLGNGLGENFWCVLFPPLCLLDAEEQETEEIEYTSFIKEIIDKYF